MFTAEDEKRIRESIAEFRAYFQAVIAARRVDPREDLTTALVQAEEEDQKLDEWEVLSLLMLLLVAGNETTTNLQYDARPFGSSGSGPTSLLFLTP